MGRASNRNKANRQAGHTRQARRAMRLLENGLRALMQEMTERKHREAAASRAWCGDPHSDGRRRHRCQTANRIESKRDI